MSSNSLLLMDRDFVTTSQQNMNKLIFVCTILFKTVFFIREKNVIINVNFNMMALL